MNFSAVSDQRLAEPGIADIEDAARRIKGQAVLTPLLESPALNARLGGRLLVKAEPLQRTGSFKFRGAYNRLSRIEGAARKAGVVAYSSGNHAQGVACAAQMLGMPALIVMPSDAPAMKIRNTKGYGAEVKLYDRNRENREEIGRKLMAERGATLVPPYDDPFIIAGQGTIGLEIPEQAKALGAKLDAVIVCCGGGGLIAGQGTIGLEIPEQAKALGAKLDAVIVCCGGGGLISGTALALSHTAPGVPVYASEPEGFDDTARSLKSGKREKNDPAARSVCDALLSPMPGELTFQINKRLLKGGLVVSEAEVYRAMATAFDDLKLVVEPGGAVALAAALAGKIPVAGRTVAVVCSGGNVDPVIFATALRAA